MNKTEKLAYKWLKKQGYKGLIFQNRNTPDFITGEGKGFEVKLLRSNSLFFAHTQLKSCRLLDTKILVWSSEKPEPDFIIPIKEIKGSKNTYWKNIRIIVDRHSTDAFIRVGEDIFNALRKLKPQGQTWGEYMESLIPLARREARARELPDKLLEKTTTREG